MHRWFQDQFVYCLSPDCSDIFYPATVKLNHYSTVLWGRTFHNWILILVLQTLRTAISTYREHKSSWEGLMKRGMSKDFTWDHAAEQYEQIFQWAFIDRPYVM